MQAETLYIIIIFVTLHIATFEKRQTEFHDLGVIRHKSWMPMASVHVSSEYV